MRKPSMIARVSGRRIAMVVPAPSWLSMVAVPRRASMLRFTTSMTDAASGQVADLFGGGETGFEEQFEQVSASPSGSASGAEQALFDGLLLDSLAVQAAAVVGDLDDDAAGLVIGVQADLAARRLALRRRALRRLDAVVDGVAHHVRERVADLFDHGLVEFGHRRR
jgi:hypothetical protein